MNLRVGDARLVAQVIVRTASGNGRKVGLVLYVCERTAVALVPITLHGSSGDSRFVGEVIVRTARSHRSEIRLVAQVIVVATRSHGRKVGLVLDIGRLGSVLLRPISLHLRCCVRTDGVRGRVNGDILPCGQFLLEILVDPILSGDSFGNFRHTAVNPVCVKRHKVKRHSFQSPVNGHDQLTVNAPYVNVGIHLEVLRQTEAVVNNAGEVLHTHGVFPVKQGEVDTDVVVERGRPALVRTDRSRHVVVHSCGEDNAPCTHGHSSVGVAGNVCPVHKVIPTALNPIKELRVIARVRGEVVGGNPACTRLLHRHRTIGGLNVHHSHTATAD